MNIHRTAEDIHIINAVDPSAVRTRFREVLAHFGSGVVVITSIDSSGAPVGMTVGSFTSISIEPPLVGFFAGHNSTTLPHVLGNSEFCVNVLSEDQHSLARVFARSGSDKFEGVDWTPSINGSPRLAGAHAWIDCTVDEHRAIGDHRFVVGGVGALVVPATSDPLVFHRSLFHGLRAHR
ncbi:flavin reductase (DIM6/NTAB) family NADH-FMN oxidoreductase RutF [Rhodococcus sp. SMB37]|uniref:flavin reductase family protein n=1 Tax=Rhodococcus sp. SMB37 TaxID=2512213 RepID=UPI0010DA664C|nr:flavin reductase family protein [Rhodococcus sp. SMB37]TCN52744.1 flavin reductase (DIM6/NTAB) family NADH-FMN oxidoreductase RutF [Rhodococcus sp. SMB37]